ncbi:MAG: class D sortase [Niameybacter sp.]
MKQHKNRKKVLAWLMMLVGMILILLPIGGRIYTQYEQQKLYAQYQQSLLEREAALETMNETLGSDINIEDTANDTQVIGLVTIPKINVSLLFAEGVTKQALKYAVGHMPGTSMPGEVGNCAIAGHRSYTFGEYFNRLDEVEVGDDIQITMGETTYTYKVYESFLVDPSEVWVTEPVEDRKIVTLITCHPVVKANQRLIVRGEWVPGT